MNKRAIILCGGKGKRLRPYTQIFPKSLMPIDEMPILEIVVRQLIKYKFDHITLAVNHQARMIESFFENGSKWNIKIDYSLEDKPLGTMGPLKLINDLPENFIVMNADILTDLNFDNFYKFHTKNNHLFTISSHSRIEKIDYGVLIRDKKNKLINFKEKPDEKFIVSMGIYAVNKKILTFIPKNKKFGFDDLMYKLIKSKVKINTKDHKNYWLDIGRPEDYLKASEVFDNKRKLFLDV